MTFKGNLKLSKEAREKIRQSRLGKKLSEKTKRKLSRILTGHKVSKATREKISKANKGKKNGFYGKTHTQEAKDAMSASRKGKYKGEKNPNWKPSSEHKKPFSRGLRNRVEYKDWRKAVFARDNWTCQMCFTHGGSLQVDHIKPFGLILHENNIKTIEDIKERLKRGADKVVINTMAFENAGFIGEASKVFGRQCIVVGIDVKINFEKEYEVYVRHGKKATGLNPVEWAKEAEKRGAGEIFLNSIDRDGTAKGYDIKLIKMIVDSVSIPVIACGGVGIFEHFVDGIKDGQASAVSAGNIFNFTENSVIQAKKILQNAGINIRPITWTVRQK